MKKILVPIDFSEVSRYAAEFAADLAKESDAEVIFMYCMQFDDFNDYSHGKGADLQFSINQVKESVNDKMQKFIADLEIHLKVDIRISNIHLLEAIKDTVREENIELIILGTKGSSGWSEFLIGSNTEKVVRLAECPVISVPVKTSFDSIKKILVPIDLVEMQDQVMIELRKLQKLFSAQIEFLWIDSVKGDEKRGLVTEDIKKFLGNYGFENSSFTIADESSISQGILNQAAEVGADMLSMATHSRKGISHWLSGSLTEDTINQIKIPVWTFKLEKS